jgi:hypothetical protein
MYDLDGDDRIAQQELLAVLHMMVGSNISEDQVMSRFQFKDYFLTAEVSDIGDSFGGLIHLLCPNIAIKGKRGVIIVWLSYGCPQHMDMTYVTCSADPHIYRFSWQVLQTVPYRRQIRMGMALALLTSSVWYVVYIHNSPCTISLIFTSF